MKGTSDGIFDAGGASSSIAGRQRAVSGTPNRLASLGRPTISEESRIHKLSATQRKPGKSSDSRTLMKLIGLPLDIFFEIATYLEPFDILHLARVSHHFRSVFRPQNSRYTWITARQNVPGLPDCPSDLNEAQYASLMFEHVCQACGIKTPKVDYALRLRFCGACHKKNIYRGAAIARDADWGKIPLTIYTLLPRARSSELESTCNSSINTPCHAYYAPELHAVKDQYCSLLKDDAALASFVKERQDFSTRLMQDGRKLLEWDSKCKNEEKMKRNEKLLDREDDIEDRLVKLGWDADDFPSNDWRPYATIWRDAWTKLVEQPRELTDKSWHNLRPKLVYILEHVAEGRRREEIKERICGRQAEFSWLWKIYLEQFPLAQRDLMPNGREAANSPIIKACLAEDEGKLEVTAERFDFLVPTALAEVEGHLPKIEQYLIANLTDSPFTANTLAAAMANKDHDPLQHAAALFDCPRYWCRYLSFPELLSHSHIRERDQWLTSTVRYNSNVPSVVEDVLRALNLPLTSTHDDLAPLDGRFKCLCGDPAMEYPTSFRAIIHHIVDVNQWHDRVWKEAKVEDAMRRMLPIGQGLRFDIQNNLCNDHVTKNLPSLLTIVPTFEEACSLYPRKIGTPIAYCAVCRFLGGRSITGLRSLEDAWYHLESKHKIKVDTSAGLDSLFAKDLVVFHTNRLATHNLLHTS